MNKLITSNKKAYYEYQILDTLSCGIKLCGSEIKPIKESRLSISEAYCYISDGELFVKGMYIAEHKGNVKTNNHDTTKDRKLLAKKIEIERLKQKVGEKGLTIIPLEVILTDKGLIKIIIGLSKGKNVRDKRLAIKEKDIQKDLKKSFGE